MTPVPLVQHGAVGISWSPAETPGPLIIAFSSIGHDPARPPSPEFVRSTTRDGRAALFVSDASRSWGNAPEFATALSHAFALVQSRVQVTRVVTLGLSMGGFCALAATTVLPVEAVLAIGPQFSVDPTRINEPRWREWTTTIAPFRLPCVPLNTGAWRVVLHGTSDDQHQAAEFPRTPGLDHILFAQNSHSDLMPHLKSQGGFQGMLDAVTAGDRRRLLRLTAAAGGQRRSYDPR